ncbi:MAG: NAD(P)/FAD-dependent oxidoreductase [Proteobacteria bacterium]|nr:NAD(P)/FAD-dependent oxidoreductase [Pseudomonadota bacterium]
MTEKVDCIVIGAGVVGLAVAAELASAGREVVVLERHRQIGTETSSRNSEVIHAGIYYATGSQKAKLCVRGKELLYRYCVARGVPHSNCGKIIVATQSDHLNVLKSYQAQALANGAGDLTWLTSAQIRDMEPEVEALAGVFSPTTGIIDSHQFMLALQGDLQAHGGMIAFATEVQGLSGSGRQIQVLCGDYALQANWVINSAGLRAPDIARWLIGNSPAAHFARGHYYAYAGPQPFKRLIYPVAEPGGLGVHVTLDMAGQVKFGPDVRWIDSVDYTFDDSNREAFIAAIRAYFPGLNETCLHPDYTGVRPKISGPSEPAADFRIDGPDQHGTCGLVNLLGIESPGLTAALAIAQTVEQIVCA